MELGLADESQDWGVINADPRRLDEFITAYDRPDLTGPERFEIVELLLASANELLCSDASADLTAVRTRLPRMRADADVTVEYWARLPCDSGPDPEFPIAVWLRALAA